MDEILPIEGKDAILIAGPTASGKSALALELARRHGGEIVNADSMQVYDGLRVLTARPGADELSQAPHHLYGHVAPEADYSTGRWLDDAEEAIAAIRARGHLPIVVGGTGLYFRALTGGLSEIPAVPTAVREEWRAWLAREGGAALHAELARRDPEMAARLNPGDTQRVLRAIEVHAATGSSLASFQAPTGRCVIDPERAARIVFLPDRSVLYPRINRRLEQMVEHGALEEVAALVGRGIAPTQPVMKAIGVPEFAAHLRGEIDLAEAIRRAAMNSRRYAKRQMTWMRNQLDASWSRRDIFP